MTTRLVNFLLDPDDLGKLDDLARTRKANRSQVIRALIREATVREAGVAALAQPERLVVALAVDTPEVQRVA